MSHLVLRNVNFFSQKIESDRFVWYDPLLQNIKPNISEKIIQILCKLMVSEYFVVFVFQDLLNLLNIILLKSSSKIHNCDNLFVVFIDFGFSGVGVIDLRIAEHACKNDVDKNVFGSEVSALLVILKAFKQFIQRLIPLLFGHVHFTTTFLYDAHYSRVIDHSIQIHSLRVNPFHPLFIVDLVTHLNLECECLQ